jgi:4-hydroxyacetophenone monooxygenase
MKGIDFNQAVRNAVADEPALRRALAQSDIAPLLMVLVHLSGRTDLMEQVAPHIQGPWSFMQTVPEDLKQAVRDQLVDTLKAYAQEGRPAPAMPSAALLRKMMSAGVGQPVPAEYIPLLLEEMSFGQTDLRAVQWHTPVAPAGAKDFKVVVIGAGFGGLCAAIRLKQLGIPFEVLEKNPDVGGTWLENRYPGCAVDTPNHFYSYSFHVNNHWTRHFSRRDEILAYIHDVVRTYDLRPHIRFGVEVSAAQWDEAAHVWRVQWHTAQGGASSEQGEIACQSLITAVGQLNRPSVPKIPGLAEFKGPCLHTAQWDPSVDLAGKRVAMIGTGASAMQTGPSAGVSALAALVVLQPQLSPGSRARPQLVIGATALLLQLAALSVVLGQLRRLSRLAAQGSVLEQPRYFPQCAKPRGAPTDHRPCAQGARRRRSLAGQGHSQLPAVWQAHAARQPLVPHAQAS